MKVRHGLIQFPFLNKRGFLALYSIVAFFGFLIPVAYSSTQNFYFVSEAKLDISNIAVGYYEQFSYEITDSTAFKKYVEIANSEKIFHKNGSLLTEDEIKKSFRVNCDSSISFCTLSFVSTESQLCPLLVTVCAKEAVEIVKSSSDLFNANISVLSNGDQAKRIDKRLLNGAIGFGLSSLVFLLLSFFRCQNADE